MYFKVILKSNYCDYVSDLVPSDDINVFNPDSAKPMAVKVNKMGFF